MGTKNNPGNYDCYANAEPDEPMFILLARDKYAPLLVELWACIQEELGKDYRKTDNATECAESMREWYNKNRRDKPIPPRTYHIYIKRNNEILDTWYADNLEEATRLALNAHLEVDQTISIVPCVEDTR